MTTPLISCIIAVFNGEQFLREALDSILAQTYHPLEILVVDDGSTDRTPEIVSEYADAVRYFRQSNAGPGAARNTGLNQAKGEFIAFLDADDLWHKDKLARQISCFKARPDLEICVTHAKNFWVPELREEERLFQNHRLSKPVPAYITQTLLARRDVFEKLGLFNASFRHVHDSEWFFRAKEQGVNTELLSDTLVYRRLHHTNRSRQSADSSLAEYFTLVKNTLDRQRSQEKPS
jgi:glycosyltransferase involved in cell wall biosynthesis